MSRKEIIDHYRPIGLKAVAAAAGLCSGGKQTSGGQDAVPPPPDPEKVREG